MGGRGAGGRARGAARLRAGRRGLASGRGRDRRLADRRAPPPAGGARRARRTTTGSGSGRSIPGFDLLGALHACAAAPRALRRPPGRGRADHPAPSGSRPSARRSSATPSDGPDARAARARRARRRGRLGLRARPGARRGARAARAVRHGQPAAAAARARRARSTTCGRWGRGGTLRFSVGSGGVSARAVAFGCDGRLRGRGRGAGWTPRSGSSATSGTARSSRGWCCATPSRARRRRSRSLGEPDGLPRRGARRARRAIASAPAPVAPEDAPGGGPPRPQPAGRARRRRVGRRRAGAWRVCADVPRRLAGSAARSASGGFDPGLPTHALERDPALAERLRAPGRARPARPSPWRRGALLDAGSGFTHLAWGEPELRFAQQMHELEYGLRASLVALYRSLRLRGRVTGEELEHLLRGDGPHGRPARLAARLIRVLAELELVSLDRDLPALAIAGDCADRARALGGVQGLCTAIRGRTTIPEQRKSSPRRLSRARPEGRRGRRRRAEDGDAGRRCSPSRGRRSTGSRIPTPTATVERSELTATERRLLGDLFAIVEEHAHESAAVDRPRPGRGGVRLRLRAPRRPAPALGRGLHHPPGRRGQDLRRHAPRHRDAVRGAAARHRRGHLAPRSRRCRRRSARRSPGWSTASPSSTGLTFQSRDEAQAENYRKMMVAMATDIRVILIKLADRLHNMRTIGAMPKQKQIEKARETLDIYAPIAHRLGIHAIKWELEDLAFQTLHPRKYNEIKGLVAQQRAERERYVNQAGELPEQGARRARHRGRDLRPRQALLLDLLQDDQEGARVQRDLRPDRDARDRRARSRTATARSA